MSQFLRSMFRFSTETFFISLFLAFYGLRLFLDGFDLSLESMPKLLIGISTIEGLDVTKRVALFYRSAALFSGVFLLINGLLNKFRNQIDSLFYPLHFLTNISVIGILILVASFYTPTIVVVFNALMVFLAFSLVYFPFLKSVHSNVDHEHLRNRFVSLVLISISLSFAFRDVLILLLNQSPKLFFNEILLIVGLIVFGLDVFLAKKNWGLTTIKSAAIVLIAFPILSIVSRELAWVFKSRAFSDANIVGLIWSIGLAALILFAFLMRRRLKDLDIDRFASTAVLIGLSLFAFYQPMIEEPREMFELANPALSLERFFRFNEWPLMENFNSHVLFELLFGFLYTVLHGYDGLDFLTYNFLHFSLAIVLIFFFMRRFLDNSMQALIIVFLLPFLFIMFPASWAMILLIPFLLHRYYIGKSGRNLLYVMLGVFGMILWKIDLGYASLLSVFSILLILYVAKEKSLKFREWLPAGMVFLSLAIIVFALAIFNDIPLLDNLLQAYHYVSSSQAHGYVDIAKKYDTTFFIHYFIFPSFIILFIIYLLKDIKSRLEIMPYQTLSILFLSFFYLFNFHRGLIRHALIGSDDWVSPFVFFIIPASVFFIHLDKKKEVLRLPAFLISATMLILAFSYPEVKNVDLFAGNVMEKYALSDSLCSSEKLPENRLLARDDDFIKRMNELKEFTDAHLSPDESFYDYSNSPMLYYYLERKVPSYFNQPLLSLQDEYLQDRLIESMGNGNVPLVVYSNSPENWYDAQDGIPKNIRHYLIGEYIHKNYFPLNEVGGYEIWGRKDKYLENDSLLEDSLSWSIARRKMITTYKLKRLPAIWANSIEVESYLWTELKRERIDDYEMSIKLPASALKHPAFMKLSATMEWGEKADVQILLKNEGNKTVGTFNFTSLPEDKEHLIRLSSQSAWYFENITEIEILTHGNINIDRTAITEAL